MSLEMPRLLLAAAGMAAASAAIAAAPARAGTYYCNDGNGAFTPPNTNCGQSLIVNGTSYNRNQSYAKGFGNDPNFPVCEGIQLTSNNSYVSFRCGGTPVFSGCDAAYGTINQNLTMTAGNGNSGLTWYIVGEGYAGPLCA